MSGELLCETRRSVPCLFLLFTFFSQLKCQLRTGRPGYGVVDGVRKIPRCPGSVGSVVHPRRCEGFPQTIPAASGLVALGAVHRSSNCRRYHDQLRTGRSRELGGQSANALVPDPSRCRLVATQDCGGRHGRPGRGGKVANLANSRCRDLLRHNRIGQLSVPVIGHL